MALRHSGIFTSQAKEKPSIELIIDAAHIESLTALIYSDYKYPAADILDLR